MADLLSHLSDFGEIVQSREPLGPFTQLKIGGPAEALIQPRSIDELQKVVRRCRQVGLPFRVLDGGGNLLIRDEGVKGIVLRLSAPPFTQVKTQGRIIHCGAGASLASLISEAARHGLTGLEDFVGLPGTVGGALRNQAGDRFGDLGQRVRQAEALDSEGNLQTLAREDLEEGAALDALLLLTVEFDLDPNSPENIVKRMRKAWILRKAAQPFSFQAAARMFKNPPGLNAAAMIEQAGLVGTRVGGATVSDRDASYVVVDPGTSSRDVLRLLDLIRARVEERFNVDLESDITVW